MAAGDKKIIKRLSGSLLTIRLDNPGLNEVVNLTGHKTTLLTQNTIFQLRKSTHPDEETCTKRGFVVHWELSALWTTAAWNEQKTLYMPS